MTTFSLLTLKNGDIRQTIIKVETLEGDSFEDWQRRARAAKEKYLKVNPKAEYVDLRFAPQYEFSTI